MFSIENYCSLYKEMFLFQLCLTVGDKVFSFLTGEENGSSEVDAMIQALSTAIRNIFPTVPLT